MKFVAHRDFDYISSSLNFTTPDLQIIGGCDLYTTKAAGTDKKLYKNIETDLEAQYESNLQFSRSLSPPQQSAMAYSLNLDRKSPFGNLGTTSVRRTFAYLIATLNASHPDYDFSMVLRPSDFKREKSLRHVMNTFDSTMYNLRPRPTTKPTVQVGASYPPNSQAQWGPGMWRMVDQQMSLKECVVYRYTPEEFDPFEDEAGHMWSMNYFFFNRARKRVCYLYLRGVSILAQGGTETPLRTPVRENKDVEDNGYLSPNSAGARKRAEYWFGGDILRVPTGSSSLGAISETEDFSPPKRPVVNDDDVYILSDEDTRSARSHSTLRGVSEEIVGAMDM